MDMESEREPQPFDPGLTQRYTGTLRRIVNRDGTFNVRRRGTRLVDFHLYQFLIGLSWPAFIALVVATFLAVSLLFAVLYYFVGVNGLQGTPPGTRFQTFLNELFFSVQTITTVGYGAIAPRSMLDNAVAGLEAMMGVMGFAFGAALLYGRFSRPTARIQFSAHALIAPYRGGTSLQIRVANPRSNALVDLEATLVLMLVEGEKSSQRRTYAKLELERSNIFFLPLTWTIVHPIVEGSPLFGRNPSELAATAAEVLVLVRGFDDAFSQVVNARYSYRHDEILWDRKFTPAFHTDESGHLVLDLAKLNANEEAISARRV
jgi:inward rectifier potassium channel